VKQKASLAVLAIGGNALIRDRLRGVEAVIDKDFASSLLARSLQSAERGMRPARRNRHPRR
jgi:carbamate kinase